MVAAVAGRVGKAGRGRDELPAGDDKDFSTRDKA